MKKNSANTNQIAKDEILADLFFSSNLKLILAIIDYEEGNIDNKELTTIRRQIMKKLGIPNQINKDALAKSLSRFTD